MSNLRTESVERSIIVSARAAITKLVTVIYMQSKCILTIIIVCKIIHKISVTYVL